MSKLSDETILYRAVRKKGWIDPDSKEVDAEAFLLRPNEDSLSANLKPEDTYRRLNKCYGVISFSVASLRKRGLDAIQDREDHVKIINVPNPEQNRQKALDLAVKLARQSQLYLDWIEKPLRKRKPN